MNKEMEELIEALCSDYKSTKDLKITEYVGRNSQD
jgi:hypothetical protein